MASVALLLPILLCCWVMQGFFCMMEMACISFNKLRLQYYVSKQLKRAIWLRFLLQRPAYLFGTTLLGGNACLLLGAECAKRIFESMGLPLFWAPMLQISIVLIFVELSPLLAGRRHPEQVALTGVPLLCGFFFLFSPVVCILNLICRLVYRICGHEVELDSYISREELKNILEDRDDIEAKSCAKKECSAFISNVFSLKNKQIKDLYIPLTHSPLLPSGATVADARVIVSSAKHPFIALYQRTPSNIIGVIYTDDLWHWSDSCRLKTRARSPCFLMESASLLGALEHLEEAGQEVAVVLDQETKAVGFLTQMLLFEEILGLTDGSNNAELGEPPHSIFLEKTFPAAFPLSVFNEQFQAALPCQRAKTLEKLMANVLGHAPARGEKIRVDRFELIVLESSPLGVKIIGVKTCI